MEHFYFLKQISETRSDVVAEVGSWGEKRVRGPSSTGGGQSLLRKHFLTEMSSGGK